MFFFVRGERIFEFQMESIFWVSGELHFVVLGERNFSVYDDIYFRISSKKYFGFMAFRANKMMEKQDTLLAYMRTITELNTLLYAKMYNKSIEEMLEENTFFHH